jgi:hypothetical protein
MRGGVIQSTLRQTLMLGRPQGSLTPLYAYRVHQYVGLRACGVSTCPNALARVTQGMKASNASPRGRRLVVFALFEKFTERSIKSVMLAQEWARNNGDPEVSLLVRLNLGGGG